MVHQSQPNGAHESQSSVVTHRLQCELCDFSEPCTIKQYFAHLGAHLKSKETVNCPFVQCQFKSSVYSTFTGHKCRYHCNSGLNNIKPELICDHSPAETSEEQIGDVVSVDYDNTPNYDDDNEDYGESVSYRLASLLLRMQTILHVSKSATQEIVNELYEIGVLAGEFTNRSIEGVLREHNCNTDSTVLTVVKRTLQETNPLCLLSKTGQFGTDHRRSLFFRNNFPVIEPVEYILDNTNRKKTFVYVPILSVLTELLNRNEKESLALQSGHFKTFRDGLFFKENPLLSRQELSISIGLYIDDFETCNPLGTSRKKNKVCAIYWVLANLPIKYRSSLQSIYLAVLCNSNDIKTFGYEKILEPFIKDLQILENQGLFIQRLGASVKGTVLFVSADNLAAHSLAGFQESFTVDKFCRFCLASRRDIQTTEVRGGLFPLRTKLTHEADVLEVKQSELIQNVNGVKRNCVLDNLTYFNTVTGFPPDFLHDLLEGIVPFELSLCLKKLISNKYFTLDELNSAIQNFPYLFSDKTNRPYRIPPSFRINGTIGGNGHENWTLLRLLPLIIGELIPENDITWGVILKLKDLVELLATPSFTDQSLCYLEENISVHRQLLQEAFPDCKLRPKHHFIEHYPYLIRCFGPLLDCWTIRFEAKHSFFLKVVRDVNNFKNILLTLATRHQHMLAYFLDMPSLFKPPVEVSRVSLVSLDILDNSVKKAIRHKYKDVKTVSLATSVILHGTKYSEGMFVSVGSTSGLPDFGKILKVLIVGNKASFIIECFSAWYLEHFRCYELTRKLSTDLQVADPEELNSFHPVAPYMVRGKLMVSPKVFLLH